MLKWTIKIYTNMQSQGEIMVKNRKYTSMKSHNKKKTIAKCQYYERTGNSFFGFLRSRKVWLWWSTSLLFWRQRLIFRQVRTEDWLQSLLIPGFHATFSRRAVGNWGAHYIILILHCGFLLLSDSCAVVLWRSNVATRGALEKWWDINVFRLVKQSTRILNYRGA